jgi:hypothetical protein
MTTTTLEEMVDMNENGPGSAELRLAQYAAVAVAALTLVTFGLAMIAVPPSGPFCPGDCMEYPFEELMRYFPRDYLWMYAAIPQLLSFLVFAVAVYFTTPTRRKVFAGLAGCFAAFTVLVLMVNYYVQFSVVPVSVSNGQFEGIPLLTQYNGYGVFIAMEELGFFFMSLAFLAFSFTLERRDRLEKVLAWILTIPFVATVLSLVLYTIQYGIERDYRVEVATITANWTVAIVGGFLYAVVYRKRQKGLVRIK